ncbi:DNA topoisomerase III [Vibrio splendidus 12B01]|nr:DNA topoisomerase III [Vibrio splendidus 12B01]
MRITPFDHPLAAMLIIGSSCLNVVGVKSDVNPNLNKP